MIKALALRFRPASVRSSIYLMSGIVVLLGGAALAFFYWQTSEFRKIETLANSYHLATLDACASIKEELFLLEKASDQKSPTQGNGLVLLNQIHSSAHIIEKRTDHILLLQDTFRHPEFQATVRRLEARTRQLLRLVAAEEATEGIAPALLQREVASLQVVTGQLQRLHASSYKEAAAGLTTQQQLNTRNLFIFVGVLLAVGFLVIWRIVVVTAAKGSEEKEYGPTVVLAIFLAGGIFLLDLLAPLGVAGAVPYVALVLVSLSLPHRKHTLAAATFASVLTVLGFFLSPAGGTLWVVLANRGLALFAIWVTATLGLLHKQAEQALRFTQVAVDHYSNLALWMTPDARFFYVNDAACRILGYSREELTSMKVSDINLDIPEETWPKIWSKIKQSGGFTFEARVRTKGGRIFPAEVKTNYVVFQGKEYNCSLVRDITERKRAEEQIKTSLREKEVLLQEVHHRVKNNLQVIVSLLNLQAARVTDRQTREMFTESRSRVRAIALMHETLYQSKDLSRIDFGEYSHTLAANLFASYGVDPEVVSWRINVENGFLGVDTAIPCGLIVSELISNSLKYAFPAGKHGEICIDFRRDDGNKCILIVKDNGIGLPKEFDLRKLESLGLQLVCTLTDQLDGSLELDCTEGTEFRITFAAGRTTERDTDNGQRTNPGS